MGFNLQAEWDHVSGAPLLFFGALVMMGGSIWLFFHLLYRSKIERLEQDVRSEQGEIARLQARLADQEDKIAGREDKISPPSPSPPPNVVTPVPSTPDRAAERASEFRRQKDNAFMQINRARSGAQEALASRKGFDAAAVRLESALMTASRAFNLQYPKPSRDRRLDLQIWLKFLDEVWPLVEDENISQAQGRAANLATMKREMLLGRKKRS